MYIRITPDNIQTLKPNEIFVFGSNLSGIHGGGAARLAYEKFGAIYGQGVGIMGQSYAIPTKSEGIKRTLSIAEIKPHVYKFISWARYHCGNTFLVTEIGCGLAGYEPKDIAPLFKESINIQNIYLPQRFIDIITCKN
jgi:hypothetical protein